MYSKPKLERYGSFRELTLAGLQVPSYSATIFALIGCPSYMEFCVTTS